MATDIGQITGELKARREALLRAYDDEDLHQLRVNIRRVRTVLEHHPDTHARALRQDWSRLARNTNVARDWDTLALYATDALAANDWPRLQPLVNEHRAHAHGRVLGTLESSDWQTAYGQWKHLVARNGNDSGNGVKAAKELRHAARRALRCGRRAIERGDERSWHKFRISIKNLRYTLDNVDLTGGKPHRSGKAILKSCKGLQDELGTWHDTVVHRGLLEQLAADQRVANDPSRLELIDMMGTAILARGARSLKRVKRRLNDSEELLKQVAAGS